MSKNQSKMEAVEPETWANEESSDFVEPDLESSAPVRSKLETRLKLEDLMEQRRLKKILGDYDSFEIEEGVNQRLH